MKKALKVIFSAAVFSSALICGAAAQELTAKQIADKAVEKANPDEAIKYVKAQLESLTVASEKRSTYAFLGSLQESMALYADAQRSYASAAGIAAVTAEGMPKKSSERLVIDAVRCALSAGEYSTAESFLNSAVRNSKNAEIQAIIKLYEQWCALSKAETYEEAAESIAMLKAYADLPSMSYVKPSILLTLWYITGEESYSAALKSQFPKSAEYAVASGKVQVYPAPFWYFVPRKK